MLRILFGAALLAAVALPALAADDILDAIDQARKAYQSGDMANAKQSLDLASQLIAQKNGCQPQLQQCQGRHRRGLDHRRFRHDHAVRADAE